MKFLRQVCIVIIAMIIYLSNNATPLFANNLNSMDDNMFLVNDTSEVDDKFLENEEEALAEYNALLRNFSEQETHLNKQEYAYSVDGLYADQFPEYYAGAYINRNGKLVILVVNTLSQEEKDEVKHKLKRELGEDIIINDTEAANPYALLVNIMTQVLAITEKSDTNYSIVGFGIEDDRNCVIINFKDEIDDKMTAIISSAVKHRDALIFETQKEIDENSASANCGTAIGTASGAFSFSIGYRAKYINSAGTTVNGFITCGHALDGVSTGISLYAPGGIIGRFVTSKYKYSGKVDAAFIRLGNGSSVSNAIGTTNYSVSTTNTAVLAQGSIVKCYGKTSGLVSPSGSVRSTSYTSTCDDGITLTDMVKASYVAKHGDSGGTVFAQTAGATYYVVGIQSRINTNYSVYCKVNNINNALGTSIR